MERGTGESPASLLFYLITGTILGILFVKGEVVSWFRIQEMFRLQSIHMYGTIGSAVAVGGISIRIIKRFNLRSLTGDPIEIEAEGTHPGFPAILDRRNRVWAGMGSSRRLPGPDVHAGRRRSVGVFRGNRFSCGWSPRLRFPEAPAPTLR